MIELLLYVAAAATVVFLYSALLFSAQAARQKNEAVIETQEQSRFVLAVMEQEIGSAYTLDYPSPGSASSSLSLTSIDASRNPVVFYLEDGRVYERENTQPWPLTSARVVVDSLGFEALPSGSSTVVQIAITSHAANPGNRSEFDYRQAATSTVVWH